VHALHKHEVNTRTFIELAINGIWLNIGFDNRYYHK